MLVSVSDDLFVTTRHADEGHTKGAVAIEQLVWRDIGFLDFTESFYTCYYKALAHFADYQLCLVSRRSGFVVATANCLPFHLESPTDLQPEGWDWLVAKAWRERNRMPNTLAGLAVSIPPVYRASGYARLLINAMKTLAQTKQLAGPIIPVRPTLKAQHTHVAIEEYLSWRDDQGRHFDPWLRTHVNAGAKIIGTCARSMSVTEPIGFWESWTGQRFETSGAYPVTNGISLLQIDLANGVGHYEEPNIWVSYD